MQRLSDEKKVALRDQRLKLRKRLFGAMLLGIVLFLYVYYLTSSMFLVILMAIPLFGLLLCLAQCTGDISNLNQALQKNQNRSIGVEL